MSSTHWIVHHMNDAHPRQHRRALLGRSWPWAALFLSAAALAACGNPKVVALAQDYATKMCACSDADCARKVDDEHRGKAAALHDARGTSSDAKAVKEALLRGVDCAQRFVGASASGDPKRGDGRAK